MGVKRIAAAVAVATMVAVGLGPSAGAAPPAESGAVERGDGELGYVYWSDGYLAITGSAVEFCTSPTPPVGPIESVVTRGNGSQLTTTRATVPVSVYEYPGEGGPDDPFGGFDFLIANCGAIVDGDDSTVPIEPVATGDVELRSQRWAQADGSLFAQNTLVGRVTTSDGGSAHLRARARAELADFGETLVRLLEFEVDLRL